MTFFERLRDGERGQTVNRLIGSVGAPFKPPTHLYESDPQSGAGNCICGASEHHRRHPHEFTPALVDPDSCVCALGPDAECHNPRWYTGLSAYA